jgi:hypothetical protein
MHDLHLALSRYRAQAYGNPHHGARISVHDPSGA